MDNHEKVIHGKTVPTVKKKAEELTAKVITSPEVEQSAKESTFICGTCANAFDNENECVSHQQSHNESLTFDCSECEISNDTEIDLEWHMENIHEPESIARYINAANVSSNHWTQEN